MTFDIVRDPCVTFELSLTFYLYVIFDVLVTFYISIDLWHFSDPQPFQ